MKTAEEILESDPAEAFDGLATNQEKRAFIASIQLDALESVRETLEDESSRDNFEANFGEIIDNLKAGKK